MKTFAAQWWVWRMSSPAFTCRERSTTDRYAGAHLLALQRRIRAVVDAPVGDARVEEERQVDPGRDEQDERVERHLAEEERPVVREDVAERLLHERGGAGALVEHANELPDHGFDLRLRTPHHEGPTPSGKLPAARRCPAPSIWSGSCGSGRPAGPKITLPPSAGSNVE